MTKVSSNPDSWPHVPRSRTEQQQSDAQGCATVCVGLILLLPLAIFDGWIFMVMWGWFIVPTFPSMPSLGLWTASGIALLVSWATFSAPRGNKQLKPKEVVDGIFLSVLLGGFTLLVGRFFHAFMG